MKSLSPTTHRSALQSIAEGKEVAIACVATWPPLTVSQSLTVPSFEAVENLTVNDHLKIPSNHDDSGTKEQPNTDSL